MVSTSPTPPAKTMAPRTRGLVLCVGPGGVGKTTTAASLALWAADRGHKVIVVTVDPSRRLAQALGIADRPTGEVTPVWSEEGRRLDALILDSGRVFDTIVRSCATSSEGAERILESKIYKAMAQRLSGALEYAAMALVQMLHDAGDHDLIVLDTPPTANAMDFLDAPRQLRELVDNPAARVLAGTGRVSARLMGIGTHVLMRTLGALGGGNFLDDLREFLSEFASVLEEFHRRGVDFEALLGAPTTGALLVTSASPFSAREASNFIGDLRAKGLSIDAVVLNRVDPPVAECPSPRELRKALDAQLGEAGARRALPGILAAHEAARVQRARAQAAIEAIEAQLESDKRVPVWTALRRTKPPQTLPDLRTLGEEMFTH